MNYSRRTTTTTLTLCAMSLLGACEQRSRERAVSDSINARPASVGEKTTVIAPEPPATMKLSFPLESSTKQPLKAGELQD